jgi:16S rRNA (guanine527-N7)-methyltransferase
MSEIEQFTQALITGAPRFGLELEANAIITFRDYYELMQAWNTRLHLVAPCSPAEFATRHVLESLLAINYLNENARVADIGSGAGLPIIPCLIARPDLRATLIEASSKKAVFLREALRVTGTSERANVIAERFEKIPEPQADFITCRALDRFTALLSNIIAWSPDASTLLLFGGPTLQAEIEITRLAYTAIHIPESEQIFIFIIENRRS